MPGSGLQHLLPNDGILIQSKSQRRKYKLGDEIIRQGARSEAIVIIRRGEAPVELAREMGMRDRKA